MVTYPVHVLIVVVTVRVCLTTSTGRGVAGRV